MKFFAIRHKPSGGYLPAGRGRGFTHDAPSTNDPPRLFRSRKGALQALRWWLKGCLYERLVVDSWSEDADRYGTIEQKAPEEERRAEDMEVVLLRLESE